VCVKRSGANLDAVAPANSFDALLLRGRKKQQRLHQQQQQQGEIEQEKERERAAQHYSIGALANGKTRNKIERSQGEVCNTRIPPLYFLKEN
jgi:hypothetical protein